MPADVYRPAAIEQLKMLGRQLDIPVFDSPARTGPGADLPGCAIVLPNCNGYDTLILDTAGRLHIDDDVDGGAGADQGGRSPRARSCLVADAMTGQDAVNVATGFNEQLGLTGVILTKLDGDARGGAALSIRAVTGKPIKFVGVGEKLDALEVFHADRMAQRILGMGDVLTLIEKAQATIDRDQAADMEQQLRKEGFTLENFRDQLQAIKKMGSMESLLGMIPGVGKALKQMQGMQLPDKELKRIEAIINSMTAQERRDHTHHQRLAAAAHRQGQRHPVQDVNQLLKRFTEAQKMMKKMQQLGPKGLKGLMGGGGMPF